VTTPAEWRAAVMAPWIEEEPTDLPEGEVPGEPPEDQQASR